MAQTGAKPLPPSMPDENETPSLLDAGFFEVAGVLQRMNCFT
jgi:hypothetical protein